MNSTNRVFIVSAFDKWESNRVNIMAHETVLQTLKDEGLEPQSIEGVIDGVETLSILLSGDNTLEHKVREIAVTHRQNYMVIYNDAAVEIVDPRNNTNVFVGKSTNVTEATAKEGDYHLVNGKYFIVAKK